MRSLKTFFLILFLFADILPGCAPDAPHDNPLDPLSPNHKSDGILRGKILSLGLPYTGIPNALVEIEQNGSAQLTGSDGSFSFSSAPAGNITLVISNPSYLSDTVKVTLPVGGDIDTLVHIDALPQISGMQVVTSKVDQWWPGPVYSATVSANVTDPDGSLDIDTVFVEIDSLAFGMIHITANVYQVSIDATQLPNQDLQWLVGRELKVFAVDQEKGTGQSLGFYVSRIIETEAVPISPANLDSTSAHPQFEWNPPTVSFDYTYSLQVFLVNSGTPSSVGSPISLSSSYVSYIYPDSLVSGQYFWTVAIVDQFGNSSRSKEASFMVP